jgi:MFS transporter, SHS family, lactate transporter
MPSIASGAVNPLERFRALTPTQRHTFFASFLGWTLDAFDYFILAFCITAISQEFHVTIKQVSEAVFWTLAMRPVGALLFGLLAERWGRRPSLMLSIVGYSVLELGSAFAHNMHQLIILRALFGVAMGGEWGVGAALAFEALPKEGRGFFSGLLQEGYVTGNLIAGIVFGVAFHWIGWRGMFILGATPALLVIYLRSKVDESPAWLASREHTVKLEKKSMGERIRIQTKLVLQHMPMFLFLVVLMTLFTSLSHGTQDLYPTFLQKDHGFSHGIESAVSTVANIGAFLGGIVFGSLSEVWGRKKAIITASLLAIPMIPLWAYSHGAVLAAVGGFLMQFMVQGAWGVVPVHLNELSPPPVRAVFPGCAYQIGNLLSSRNIVFQSAIALHFFGGELKNVFAGTVLIVALGLALITFFGKEDHGAEMSKAH